ncbi:MAG: TPM domain-containing protein [Candidatus Limnocylindrales bacterium]
MQASRSPMARLAAAAAIVVLLILPALASAASPGPPFPAPENNRAVYDIAGVFRAETIDAVESSIDAIEARTGAEVVVYTQAWPFKPTEEETLAHALALMNQWGIGRRGFGDGLVILFDLDPSLVHGQVQLYAGAGYKSTFLSDAERQQLYDQDMLPLLVRGDLDGALITAIQRVNDTATVEHAQRLETARQLNAGIGLVGGSLVLVGLIGWAIFHWLRYGRDPVYTDSESVLVPAPPDGMTAAVATMVLDGHVSRRTLTTAMLDLASRGKVAFREEHGPFGTGRKLSIDLGTRALAAATDDVATNEAERGTAPDAASQRAIAASRLELANRRPTGPAEAYLQEQLLALGADESIASKDVPLLAADVPIFEQQVEDAAVRNQWFGERPSRVVGRWRGRSIIEIVAGGLLVFAGLSVPMDGLTLLGGAFIVAGIVTVILASAMPARTMAGAMQQAWLLAYRRTLSKTMAQARSMDQVLVESRLDWLETPDQAVVWGTALGLATMVEDVLARTVSDGQGNQSSLGYLPLWYRGSNGTSLAGGLAGGGGGLFSSSGVPDIGGMVAALGTIGNAPPSSGSGGGGGGFGGGGGGGGGGAGGGF